MKGETASAMRDPGYAIRDAGCGMSVLGPWSVVLRPLTLVTYLSPSLLSPSPRASGILQVAGNLSRANGLFWGQDTGAGAPVPRRGHPVGEQWLVENGAGWCLRAVCLRAVAAAGTLGQPDEGKVTVPQGGPPT